MREVWELVDANENITGVTLERGTATPIPQGMYHIAVDIWVKGKDGKILLTQRHPSKAWALKWKCSGGAIVKGESPADGALRELREETGIEITEDELKYVGKTVMEEYQCIMYTYLVCLIDDVQLNLQAEEVVAAKWLEISELEDMREDIVNSVWDRYLQFREKIMR